METFGWILWWYYTITLGIAALAVLILLVAMVLIFIKRGKLTISVHINNFIALPDLFLAIITYIFISMIMFGGYL